MVITFPFYYLAWHYRQSLREYLQLWSTYVWFTWHIFSVPVLLRTLFVPWHRFGVYDSAHDLEEAAGNIVFTLIMRVLGAVIRTVTILIAVVMTIVVCVLGAVGFVIWLLAPLLVVAMLGAAVVIIGRRI